MFRKKIKNTHSFTWHQLFVNIFSCRLCLELKKKVNNTEKYLWMSGRKAQSVHSAVIDHSTGGDAWKNRRARHFISPNLWFLRPRVFHKKWSLISIPDFPDFHRAWDVYAAAFVGCMCFGLKKVQNMDFERRGSARMIVHYKTVWTLLIRNFASQKVWAIPYRHKIPMECYFVSLAALTPRRIESFWSVCSSVFLKLADKTVLITLRKISGCNTGANKASVFQKSSHCQNMSFNVWRTSILCYPWKNTTTVTAMPLHAQFLRNSRLEKCKALTGSLISFGGCLHVEWSCR